MSDARGLCHDCIVLTPGPVLGTEAGEAFLDVSLHAVRDDSDRVWVLQPAGVKVFEADGRFLRRVGRRGQGPGEFEAPTALFLAADGLVHVLDAGNLRASVVGPDFALVRDYALPGVALRAIPTPSGFVASMSVPSDSLVARPMHVVEGGVVTASFGTKEARGTWGIARILARDRAGWIYSAPFYEYEITVWSPALERRLVLDRPGLFEAIPRPTPGVHREAEPVRGWMRAIHVDARDHIWVIVSLARLGPNGPPPGTLEDYHTVIEVIDLASAKIIARAEVDELMLGFLDRETMFGQLYSSIGEPWTGTWRFRLDEGR